MLSVSVGCHGWFILGVDVICVKYFEQFMQNVVALCRNTFYFFVVQLFRKRNKETKEKNSQLTAACVEDGAERPLRVGKRFVMAAGATVRY